MGKDVIAYRYIIYCEGIVIHLKDGHWDLLSVVLNDALS